MPVLNVNGGDENNKCTKDAAYVIQQQRDDVLMGTHTIEGCTYYVYDIQRYVHIPNVAFPGVAVREHAFVRLTPPILNKHL